MAGPIAMGMRTFRLSPPHFRHHTTEALDPQELRISTGISQREEEKAAAWSQLENELMSQEDWVSSGWVSHLDIR